MITITLPTKYTAILENYDGKCKRVTVEAFGPEDAWAVASMKYPAWVVVDVKIK